MAEDNLDWMQEFSDIVQKIVVHHETTNYGREIPLDSRPQWIAGTALMQKALLVANELIRPLINRKKDERDD